jgi:hypothetical protein
MFCGLELKISAFKTLHVRCQGVKAVRSVLKHKSVGVTYRSKRLEYYKE